MVPTPEANSQSVAPQQAEKNGAAFATGTKVDGEFYHIVSGMVDARMAQHSHDPRRQSLTDSAAL